MKYSNSANILNNLEDSYCETKMNSVWDEYWVILAHYNFDIMVFSILFAYTNNMSNSGTKYWRSWSTDQDRDRQITFWSDRRSLFTIFLDHDLDLIVDPFLTDLDLILRSLFQNNSCFFKHNLYSDSK